MSSKTLILDSKQIEQKINRIAYQIYENNYDEKELIISGIADRGYILAERLYAKLTAITDMKITLDKITINKDKPLDHPIQTSIDTQTLNNKVVILVDDVLNSGKTLMYGVKFFLDFPIKKLSTAVLIDRNHKDFPVKTNYAGMVLATTLKEHVSVELGKEEAVYLV